MTIDIPEGYKPIAVRDDRLGTCVISFHITEKKFFIYVNGKNVGPLELRDLSSLKENVNDVLSMKGQYMFIDDYDIYGEQRE